MLFPFLRPNLFHGLGLQTKYLQWNHMPTHALSGGCLEIPSERAIMELLIIQSPRVPLPLIVSWL